MKSIAENHLNRFLTQYNVLVDINSYKIIEAPNYTVAIASGEYDGEFIKVWTVVNEKKMLLVTYISPNKTRELSKAEDIVYSISFDTSKPWIKCWKIYIDRNKIEFYVRFIVKFIAKVGSAVNCWASFNIADQAKRYFFL